MLGRHRARWALTSGLVALLLALLAPVASASSAATADLTGPYTGVTVVQTGFGSYNSPETRALDTRNSTVSLSGSRTATSDRWVVTFTPRIGDPVSVQLETSGGQMFVGAYLNVTVRVGATVCATGGVSRLTEYHADVTGTPNVLATDFSGDCNLLNHYAVKSSSGQLRFGAAAPYGGVDIPLTKVPLGPQLVGEATRPVTVPVTYVGAGSVTPAAPTVESGDGSPLETDVRFPQDTCSGTTLVDGSTCLLTVSTRARSTYSYPGVQVGLRDAVGTRLATLMLDTSLISDDARGSLTAVQGRVLDTRGAYGSNPPRPVPAGGVVNVPINYLNGPATDFANGLALVNLTVVTPSSAGYLSVLPSASAPTTTSAVNFAAGRTAGNLVVAPIDSTGSIHVRNVSARPLDLVVDLEAASGAKAAAASDAIMTARMRPVQASRVLDTRTSVGGARPLATGVTDLTIPLPASLSGASGVLATITVVSPSTSGWLRVGDDGEVSSVTFPAGVTTSNAVVGWSRTGPGPSETLRLTLFGAPAHVVVDVSAIIDRQWSPHGLVLSPVVGGPLRIADSRRGLGVATLPAGAARSLLVPASLRDQDTWGVLQDLVAIPTRPTSVTAYASGTTRPGTSSVLATTPGPRSATVLTGLSATGSEDLFATAGPTDVISDVSALVQLFPSTAQLGGFDRIPETLAAIAPATRSR